MAAPSVTTDTLTKGIAQFKTKMEKRFEELLLKFAIDAVDYMKSNAPWQDQTGEARAGLDAEVYQDDHEMGVILFHTVDYGIWLEIRWSGRYAIIIPTVEQKGPDLLASMNHMMDGITFYA